MRNKSRRRILHELRVENARLTREIEGLRHSMQSLPVIISRKYKPETLSVFVNVPFFTDNPYEAEAQAVQDAVGLILSELKNRVESEPLSFIQFQTVVAPGYRSGVTAKEVRAELKVLRRDDDDPV